MTTTIRPMRCDKSREVNHDDRAMLATVERGDRVTILVHAGGNDWRERTGRAVIITRGSHVALNMGGKYGRPGVATASNIVRVQKRTAERAAESSYLESMEG